MAYKTTRTPELHQPMDGLMKITLVWSLGASLGYTTWRAMRRAAQTNTNVSLKVLSGGQRTEPGVAQLHLQVCSSVHENPARAPRRPQHPTDHINCNQCTDKDRARPVPPGNPFCLLSCSARLAHQLSAVSQQLQGLSLAGSVLWARVQLLSSAQSPAAALRG